MPGNIKLVHGVQELLDGAGWEELGAFVAVAEAGSFVAAARKIGRDPSIISRRVNQLERRLGVSLLSRTTRRIGLTEVGAIYLRRVQAIFEELDTAGRDASDLAASPQGLLRVSLPMSFGRLRIAPLIAGFLVRHPQIEVDLRFADRYVDLVAEGFDVAIRLGKLSDSSLVARKLASYQDVLVAAPSYLAQHGEPQSPSDLSTHACLGFTNHAFWPAWPLTKGGQKQSIRPSGPLTSDSSEVLLSAAIDGVGIILTPDWLAGPAMRDGKLLRTLPGWGVRDGGGVYAVMPPGRLIPAKARAFVNEIAASVEANWSS